MILFAALALAPGANAVVTHADGRVLGTTPRAGASFTLTAGRRPITAAADPADHFSQSYKSLVTRFLADVAADSGKSTNVNGVVAQYGAGAQPNPALAYHTSFSAGDVLTPTGSYPPDQQQGNPAGCAAPSAVAPGDPPYTRCLTDAQLQHELTSVIARNHLPTDLSAMYFVLLPPGVDVCIGPGAQRANGVNPCTDTDYCGYHAVVQSGGPVYAVLPYAGVSGCGNGEAPNGDQAADSELSLLSHENNDAVSNPLLSGNGVAGWYDANGAEVSDKCAQPSVYGAALGGGAGAQYNQVINGHHYYLQDEFANVDGSNGTFDGCEQRPGAPNDGVSQASDASPLGYHGGPVVGAHVTYAVFWDPGNQPAGFTASASAVHLGQPVSFTADLANTDGSLNYDWSFGDGATATTTAPTVTHSFSSPGSHTVTLTILSNGAAGPPTANKIYVYFGPTARFASMRQPLVAGTTLRFNANRSTDPDGTISTWRWRFGDGAGASGPRVSHAYARPGVYTVVLNLTDGNGSSGAATLRLRVVSAGHHAAPARVLRVGRASVTSSPGRRFVVHTGRAVRCAIGQSKCRVAVTLSFLTRSGQPASSVPPRTLAKGNLVVHVGATSPLTITLNGLATRLLQIRRRLSARLEVLVRSSGVIVTRAAVTLRLVAPPP